MNTYKRKILVTLSIKADNAKLADEEAKDMAQLIRECESSSVCADGVADTKVKSAEIIPNDRRRILF